MQTEIKTAVGQANGWVDGQIISNVFGTITKLFAVENKTGPFGDYTIQNGELETSQGKIRIVLFDHELPFETKGKPIIFSSTKGKKCLSGIKYEVRKYKRKTGEDVTEECLAISVTAKIEIGDGEDFEKSLNNNESKSNIIKTNIQYENKKTKISVEDLINKILQIHYLCHKEVHSLYKDESTETKQAYTASLFIEANKQGISNLEFKNKSEHEKQDILVPKGEFAGKKVSELPNEEIKRLYNVIKPKGFDTEFKKAIQKAYLDLEWDGLDEAA